MSSAVNFGSSTNKEDTEKLPIKDNSNRCKTITFYSSAADSGCTTALYEFALGLALENFRVLVVDLNKNIRLTNMLIGETVQKELESSNNTLNCLFEDKLKDSKFKDRGKFNIPTSIVTGVGGINEINNIDLLPGSKKLNNITK